GAGRQHGRRAGGAELEEPLARALGHERQHGQEAHREVEEIEKEDRAHSTASMAARSGDPGAKGSARRAPSRGQPEAAMCASTSGGKRARNPVSEAAAVRPCAQYPWPDMKPETSDRSRRSAARAFPPSSARRMRARLAVPITHGGHWPQASRSKKPAS